MSWGRLAAPLHRVQPLHDRSRLVLAPEATEAPEGPEAPEAPEAPGTPDAADAPGQGRGLPFGNGRSYGDVCLNPGGRLWATRGLDRFIDFDRDTGRVRCEAGVLLDALIALALPAGWFLPVTPGTRFATVGGAIACDVHGKNHHRAGTFGEHVRALTLQRSDGSRLDCSPQQHADWLRATIGGLGLTGLIVHAELQLQRVPGPWLQTETLAYHSLRDFFALSRASEPGWDSVVSWLDCVHGGGDSRGLFFRANPLADAARQPAQAPRLRTRTLPLTPPLSLVNGLSLRAFNQAYFSLHRRRQGLRVQHLLPFHYPLDGLLHWNRMYGPRGFYQYQCVLPRAVEEDATAELLAAIRRSGQGSFLAVLKTFADRPAAGLLSFPMAGTTLALDFPEQGARTAALFERLDAIVAAARGRLYAAKDARMPAALFRQGYPQLPAFQAFRDPGIDSALARRLMGG